MNVADILIIFAVIIAAGIGMVVGLFRAVILLASFILAIILSSQFYLRLSGIIESLISSGQMAKVASFVIIFVISFVILTILGLLVYRLVAVLKLGVGDMIGGALLGIIGALLSTSLCIILLTKYPFGHSRELLKESMFVPHCLTITKAIINLLPDELSGIIHEFYPDIT